MRNAYRLTSGAYSGKWDIILGNVAFITNGMAVGVTEIISIGPEYLVSLMVRPVASTFP